MLLLESSHIISYFLYEPSSSLQSFFHILSLGSLAMLLLRPCVFIQAKNMYIGICPLSHINYMPVCKSSTYISPAITPHHTHRRSICVCVCPWQWKIGESRNIFSSSLRFGGGGSGNVPWRKKWGKVYFFRKK